LNILVREEEEEEDDGNDDEGKLSELDNCLCDGCCCAITGCCTVMATASSITNTNNIIVACIIAKLLEFLTFDKSLICIYI
jgi:hypothetical protein